MNKRDRPILTVIIPHLNAPEALDRCLASLEVELHHAEQEFSVFVVDNGSTRRPDEVCAGYPFVRVLDEPEPGPGPARNCGARMAESEIVAFLDADCTVRLGWTKAIIVHFATNCRTSVIGGDVRITCVDPSRPTAIEAYESIYGYRMRLYIERDGYTATCNMAVRREVFAKVGEFSGISIAEDVDWGRRAAALGLRIEYVPSMVIETPARGNFAELTRKWDRHIAHEFAEVRGAFARARWLIRALALAASPAAEIPRVLFSDRLKKNRERWLALLALTRIRIYRTRHMLILLAGIEQPSTNAWRG